MPWDTAVTTFSEDKGSIKRGGELPWFGTGRMVPEFEKASFGLKNVGDVSTVVTTSYGLHIIKLLEKRGVPSFDEKKAELKQMIARDSRSEASRTSMINKIKKEYKFKEVPKTKDEIFGLLDTNLSEGNWDLNKADKYTKDMIIFTDSLGKSTAYNQEDFAKYISTHQTKRQGVNPLVIGISMYNDWVGESCLSYEEGRLDKKYPDFKNLMKEYRDGILLFDLTDKMVWSKAVKDTAGLEDYYELNKTKYMWGERCEASIFAFADQKNVPVFRKSFNKGKKSVDEIVTEMNKTNANAVTKRDGKYNKGEEIINMIDWKTGLSKDIVKNDGVYLVNVTKLLPAMPKTIDEVRGSITSDYQAYLEKTWIENLRAKYPVQVDTAVLETLWRK
jgi:peptidyl-prolyl cis-trans isomerase SurA